MDKTGRTLAMALAFSTLMTAGMQRSAFAEGTFPALEVLITNRDRVPGGPACVSAPVLAQAQAEAVRIYAAAGVDLIWTGVGLISRPPSAFALVTIVMCGTHAGVRNRSADVMGFAPATQQRAGKVAYAFYDKIQQFAQRKQVNAAKLLGHVIAHEVGHLLLGYGSHSSGGIMRAEWDSTGLQDLRTSRLTFTTQQMTVIQNRVTALTH